MPESDLSLLIDAARDAGLVATRFWQKSPETWDKGGDAGPVTEADLAVNDMLKEALLGARPGYGWLSEESEDDPTRLDRESVFIVDPIDGTRAFIAGEKAWAHSLAIAHNGEIDAAVVYLPVLDKLYTAQLGGGAFLNKQPIHASTTTGVEGATVLSARNNLHPVHWHNGPPSISCHFRPSLAYRLALVAEGRFDAMLSLRDTWEWDVAAGSRIATEAGASVTDRLGKEPVFNNRPPALPGLIAGSAATHDGLLERLA